MSKHIMLVFTDAVEGEEDIYNKWYNETHLPEVVATDGIVAAQRFRVSDSEHAGALPSSYLAIYEVEGDIKATLDSLASGRATRAPLSPSMAENRTSVWFTSISERVVE